MAVTRTNIPTKLTGWGYTDKDLEKEDISTLQSMFDNVWYFYGYSTLFGGDGSLIGEKDGKWYWHPLKHERDENALDYIGGIKPITDNYEQLKENLLKRRPDWVALIQAIEQTENTGEQQKDNDSEFCTCGGPAKGFTFGRTDFVTCKNCGKSKSPDWKGDFERSGVSHLKRALMKTANWFTTRKYDPSKDSETVEPGCPHVEQDPSAANIVTVEMDSFGPVCEMAWCNSCYKKLREEEQEETVKCPDCGEIKPRKDCRAYRWYDFYAEQGDKPLIICKDCWDRPTHQRRLMQDREARYWESAQSGFDPWGRVATLRRALEELGPGCRDNFERTGTKHLRRALKLISARGY